MGTDDRFSNLTEKFCQPTVILKWHNGLDSAPSIYVSGAASDAEEQRIMDALKSARGDNER